MRFLQATGFHFARKRYSLCAMLPDSRPAALPAPDIQDPVPPNQPGLLELFVAFAKMSLAGFGGVLVWARRGIVDQHRWMTAEEFNETFALCHFLPGPNIVICRSCSDRFAVLPEASRRSPDWSARRWIATALAAVYARYGEIDALRRIWPVLPVRSDRAGGRIQNDDADPEGCRIAILIAVFTAALRLPLRPSHASSARPLPYYASPVQG
jgi:chromate transporter